ncbi:MULTISPECIES: hypothetical protein [Bacillus]|jgi:hypothetical protein|uniref:Uncharacterized protein n=2 Tax=Bacillus mycoides TaxID=1405 RepID=A0A0D6SLG9_BACMY|nr:MULTISPECIES: hypothetical protein [Bacillus]MBJ7994658.1 hypothetical protein [Bacillus cereus]KIV69379.1 hypothetical protein SZ39_4385 [Bacillus mycoides]KWU61313.1 hypothetical protein AWW70_02115 [Bacillus mycoides]MDM5428602.1 hypothetical protein [Bacillus mycoides]MED1402375.1 hypothetical protein [Bacillus mycoides]
MYDKEEVYDEEIAPLMQQILEICKREELPMVVQFYLAEESPYDEESVTPLYCTSIIIPGDRNDEEGIQQLQDIDEVMKYGKNGPPYFMAATIRKE